ncbi:MAG: hypothetical protein E5Y73_17325 [Mesorhizobium sp.]|uniref:DUF6511 domain-containing protein n=1 Tax=Mesorhizobium sp. TaxID=1871066 RepID=UPI0012295B5F|nr:DUF6511 domain-containing protein [Mesorhizobium sp.]TIL91438.1 MAG: hypothetical protein E5Y73_17325 [Mesorhizobium sp.]
MTNGKPDYSHDPAACHVCSRRAIGVGLEPARKGEPPRYLCAQCLDIVEHVAATKRFDTYELKALDGAVNAVGEYIASIDGKTELADYDELEQRMLCKAAVQGFGDRLRELVRNEVPF